MKQRILQGLGWYGAAAILVAYAASIFGLLLTQSVWYLLLNGTGAVGVALASYDKGAYQPMALNIVWAVVALVALAHVVS